MFKSTLQRWGRGHEEKLWKQTGPLSCWIADDKGAHRIAPSEGKSNKHKLKKKKQHFSASYLKNE